MKKSYTLSLEKKEWNNCLHDVYDKKKKDIKIDGFRKGQVPYDVYVKKMGVEALYMDAVDIAVDVLYAKLLKDEKTIIPVATPGIDIKNINHDEIEIEFTLVSAPKVELGKHTKLGIKKEEVVVTDSQIEHELHHLQEQFVEVKELDDDAVIKEGNVAVIDFEGFKEGKAFKGGKGEDYSLEIGSHTFIPGFEEALVGLKKGDTKDVNVTFPENYHSEELKGKDVVFKVTINSIKQRVLPEYNEDFFKDLNMDGVTDLDSLKENIKSHILGHKTQEVEDKYFDEVLTKISENASVEIPSEMISEEIDRMVEQFNQNLQYQGMNLDTYLKMLNMDLDKFKENFKPEAEKRVKYRLVLEQIVKEENITVEDKELEEYSKDMAKKYNVTEEVFLKEIGGIDFLKYDLEVRKALEIVTGK